MRVLTTHQGGKHVLREHIEDVTYGMGWIESCKTLSESSSVKM